MFGTFKLAKPPRVTDGDTIQVEGLKESLRFVGLDAEETFKDAGKRRLADVGLERIRPDRDGGMHDPSRPPKYATLHGRGREGRR